MTRKAVLAKLNWRYGATLPYVERLAFLSRKVEYWEANAVTGDPVALDLARTYRRDLTELESI